MARDHVEAHAQTKARERKRMSLHIQTLQARILGLKPRRETSQWHTRIQLFAKSNAESTTERNCIDNACDRIGTVAIERNVALRRCSYCIIDLEKLVIGCDVDKSWHHDRKTAARRSVVYRRNRYYKIERRSLY